MRSVATFERTKDRHEREQRLLLLRARSRSAASWFGDPSQPHLPGDQRYGPGGVRRWARYGSCNPQLEMARRNWHLPAESGVIASNARVSPHSRLNALW